VWHTLQGRVVFIAVFIGVISDRHLVKFFGRYFRNLFRLPCENITLMSTVKIVSTVTLNNLLIDNM